MKAPITPAAGAKGRWKRRFRVLSPLAAVVIIGAGGTWLGYAAVKAPRASIGVPPIDVATARMASIRTVPPPGADLPKFVGIARVSRAEIALSDYQHLYCLNLGTGELSRVTPGLPEGATWNPTGLAYRKDRDLLYVANYTGDNVLEGKLRCAKRVFAVTSSISSPATVRPKSVAVSRTARMLLVASEDGGNVSAFAEQERGWEPVWTTRIATAHGVATIGNAVFATSLATRELFRLDLRQGTVVRKVGRPGWNPTKQQLLWPVALATHQRAVWLADAHTGLLCRIDADTLALDYCFGGNGPSAAGLNMPYGITSMGTTLGVLSTFDGRVLMIDVEPGHQPRARAVYAFPGRDWAYFENFLRAGREPAAAAGRLLEGNHSPDRPYVGECQLGAPLDAMQCGYGEILSEKTGDRLLLPKPGGVLNPIGYEYFVQAHHGRHGSVVFSPQNRALLYIAKREERLRVALALAPDPGWKVGSHFATPKGAERFDVIEQRFLDALDEADRRRDRHGVLEWQEAARVLVPDRSDRSAQQDAFRTRLAKALSGSDGRAFLDAYFACNHWTCDIERLHALARTLERAHGSDATIETRYLPCYLAGADCLPGDQG